MTSNHDNSMSTATAGKKWPLDRAAPWLAALAALLGRLPALGAYWNQDDWGLLGRAAGLEGVTGSAVRWLPRVAYWDLMWPLAGLDPVPYAWTRLVLHAVAAAGVVRLGQRLGLTSLQALLAGLIMAATPLAFTALYWAAGIQDLLAVAAAAWALAFWCSPDARRTAAAVLLALVAVLSKETLVGLPVVMLAVVLLGLRRGRRPVDLALVAVVAAGSALSITLALQGFATGPGDPYALGDAALMLRHLLVYGWWLLQPGPSFSIDLHLAMALVGGALWLGWLLWAALAWRRGRRAVAVSWLGALATIAPLLPLSRHVAPDLAYPVEIFGCMALASLVPRRIGPWPWLVGALVVAALAWGFLGMEGRLNLRDQRGVHVDPVVRRTAVSWHAARQLPRLPIGEAGLILVQPPLTRQTARMAADLGESWVTGSDTYHALAGTLGPRLLLDDRVPVAWTNGLRYVPEKAMVLFDAGGTLAPWGFTDQALLYQALTDVGLGHFDRARLHLLRSGLLAGDTLTLLFDPDLLPVSLDHVLANKVAFINHLAAGLQQGHTRYEVGAVQTNFYRLLSVCTGIDEETLRAGSEQERKAAP
jgi:hypothetical protein